MTDALSHEKLIGALAADLKPVKPLRAFVRQAAVWLGVVVAMAGILSLFADLPGVAARLTMVPDMWLALSGSVLTAILGAIAAFQLALPDRNPWWALLPLPGLLLWLSASGLGCLRTAVGMGVYAHIFAESRDCLVFIVSMSVPLTGLLILMLRRGYSLRPNLTGLVAGIAVAGASVALLNLVHPHDPSVVGLAVHGVGVVIVAIANWTLGGRIFSSKL